MIKIKHSDHSNLEKYQEESQKVDSTTDNLYESEPLSVDDKDVFLAVIESALQHMMGALETYYILKGFQLPSEDEIMMKMRNIKGTEDFKGTDNFNKFLHYYFNERKRYKKDS